MYLERDAQSVFDASWRRSVALLLVVASVAAVARRERYAAGGELGLGSDAAARLSQRDAAAAASRAAAARAAADAARPHIVVSLVDDMGWADAPWSAVDAARHAMPFSSALRNASVSLGAYYAAKECTPSRAMMLTGRHAA